MIILYFVVVILIKFPFLTNTVDELWSLLEQNDDHSYLLIHYQLPHMIVIDL